MDDTQAKLLTEQFNHFRDSIESRFQRIEKDLKHHEQLEAEKLKAVRSILDIMKTDMHDHENRIRKIDDLVISAKTTNTIFQAGQAGLTLIASAIAAWLGSSK